MEKTLMTYINRSSFVAQDIHILKCNEYKFTPSLLGFIKQFLYLLKHRYQRYYVYFCDLHGFLPVLLFARKTVVFVGGYDATRIDDYGIFDGSTKSRIVRWIYRKTPMVIISSGHELKYRLIRNLGYVKESKIIYPGINIDYWRILNVPRDIDFITVCGTGGEKVRYRKGIDLFIDKAWKSPDKTFVIINCDITPHPSNVTILGEVSNTTLRYYYNRSKYYCQFSRYESFGIALCESMACGCIPIVSDVGIMKEITCGITTSEQARSRIEKRYSLKIRESKLKEL